MILPKGARPSRMIAYVGWPALYLFVWDVLIVVAYMVLRWEWVALRNIPLAMYGSVIGIIVSFRNNSAYARWWEARTLWGVIVNNTRSLTRQICSALLPEQRGKLVYYQIAFVHALRQQLRGLDPLEELGSLVSAEDLQRLRGERNIALALLREIGALLSDAKDREWLDALEWQAMDRNLDDLTDAQGGLERIKNTPIPKQYDYFPMLFVQIYCVLLPAGMVEQLGWFTPLGSTVVGFMFLALDKIGRDLENPFENTIHDVPMTAITKNIEANLRQALGETELPEPVKPVRGVLW